MPYHSSPIVPGRSVKARAHTARLSRVARAYVRSGSEWKGAFHKEVDIVDPVTMKPDDKTKKPTAPPATEEKEASANNKAADAKPGTDANTDALLAVEKRIW